MAETTAVDYAADVAGAYLTNSERNMADRYTKDHPDHHRPLARRSLGSRDRAVAGKGARRRVRRVRLQSLLCEDRGVGGGCGLHSKVLSQAERSLGVSHLLQLAMSKRLDHQGERWRRLAPARIVKMVSVEPGAPILQHACDPTCLEERFSAILHDVSDSVTIADGVHDEWRAVQRQLSVDPDVDLLPALFEFPHVESAGTSHP